MRRLPRRILVVCDYFLQIFVFCLSMLVVAIVRCRKPGHTNTNRSTLVSLARYSDTSVLHRKLNDRRTLDKFFSRPIFRHTIVLCVGEGELRVARMGRRVIGVDIPVPSYRRLQKLLPLTETAIRDLRAFFIIWRFLRKRGISYVEVMSPSDLMWRAILVRWASHAKLLAQVRGNLSLILFSDESSPEYMNRRLRNFVIAIRKQFLSQIFYRTCDMVVGYNVNNMQSAICGGAHPEKTFLSRIRLDDAFLHTTPVERSSLDEVPKVGRLIGLWSRLGTEKRVIEATTAVLRVLERHDDVHFVVIGDGELRGELSRLVAESGLSARVHLLGYRPRSFIASVAAHLSVAVVPYGGSNLLEAAILGLPVVAFDIEWHGEIVRSGETGWLADFRDSSDMAQCLEAALDNPGEAMRLGRNLRLLALKMFDDRKLDDIERAIFARFAGVPDEKRSAAL